MKIYAYFYRIVLFEKRLVNQTMVFIIENDWHGKKLLLIVCQLFKLSCWKICVNHYCGWILIGKSLSVFAQWWETKHDPCAQKMYAKWPQKEKDTKFYHSIDLLRDNWYFEQNLCKSKDTRLIAAPSSHCSSFVSYKKPDTSLEPKIHPEIAQLTHLSRFYRVRDNESGFKGAHKSATGPSRSFYAFSRKIVKLAAILPGHVSRIKNNEGRLK